MRDAKAVLPWSFMLSIYAYFSSCSDAIFLVSGGLPVPNTMAHQKSEPGLLVTWIVRISASTCCVIMSVGIDALSVPESLASGSPQPRSWKQGRVFHRYEGWMCLSRRWCGDGVCCATQVRLDEARPYAACGGQ